MGTMTRFDPRCSTEGLRVRRGRGQRGLPLDQAGLPRQVSALRAVLDVIAWMGSPSCYQPPG